MIKDNLDVLESKPKLYSPVTEYVHHGEPLETVNRCNRVTVSYVPSE